MKRFLNRIFLLTLICSTAMLAACSSDDTPAVPVDPPVDPQPVPPVAPSDRDVLAAHIKSDAAVLADNLDFRAIEVSAETTKQLLALMNRSRYSKNDITTAIALLTIQNMADRKNAHGLRVVFDEKGNYRIGTTSGELVFIFPATVGDYPTTLYKLTFVSNRNWDDIPELCDFTLSGMFDDKEVVLNKSVAKITLNSDYPGMAAMALGAFDFDSRIEYYAPDASDGQVACAIDLEALRNDDSLCFSLDYEQGEQSILDMTLNLPLSQDFVINSVDEALDAANGITAVTNVLGDLTLTAKVAKGSTFMPALKEVVEGVRSTEITLKEFSERVERLNSSMNMHIACKENDDAIPMKFLGEKGEEAYCLMPAFRFEGTTDYMSLKQVVDASTYNNLVEIYKKTALPVSDASAAYSDLLTMMMQILPIQQQ